MVEKSRSARIKLIIGVIGVLIVLSVLLYYLPSLNVMVSPSSSSSKVLDVSTINKYFGGSWVQNSSTSGYANIYGNNVTVHFANGTVVKLSLPNLILLNKNVSRLLGIVETNLNQINFTTFTSSNQIVTVITFNYTTSYEPHQIFDEAYKGLSSLNLTNITSNAFEIVYQNFQIGIGYKGNHLYIVFYQGNNNEFTAISELMKYLVE